MLKTTWSCQHKKCWQVFHYQLSPHEGSTDEATPSGKTLFVNIQESGETLAITGPWEKLA